ncbi:MAG TPA: STAS/SEC14 domain-containing protein [Actinomycetota bacterium]
MIEVIEGLPEGVVGLEAVGEVTADDYESVAVPAIERARGDRSKVRLLYVLGGRFTGYTGGAMWQDAELGISHPFSWERIAVVTDHDHVRTMVKGLGWLIPGKVKVFPLSARSDAESWVTA